MHVLTVLTMLRCWIADYAIIGHKARVEALLAASDRATQRRYPQQLPLAP